MELGARVAETLLARAKSAEVLDRLGDDIVKELEVDAAGLVWGGRSAMRNQSRTERWGMRDDEIADIAMQTAAADGEGMLCLPLTSPVEVTLPLLSTWTSGPVQVQSK